MHSILSFLDDRMAIPKVFGWFHILCLIVIALLCVFVVLKCRNISDKALNIILIVVSIVLILFELYKQINMSYDVMAKKWGYPWYIFPFQFCSTPMYVMLLAGLVRGGKLKEYLFVYLATYSLFAGFSVILIPSSVFVSVIGVNLQTMIHHGAMVVIAVLLYANNKVKYGYKEFLGAIYVFLLLSGVALISNLVIYQFVPNGGFNMFYISPYYDCIIPILGFIKNYVPYVVFLLLYLCGFSAISYVILISIKYIKEKILVKSDKYYKIG